MKGQVKLGQVKSGQDRFERPPWFGAGPGLGREGFPRHIRMGLHWKTHPFHILSWVCLGGLVLGASWGVLGASWVIL